MSKGIRLPVLSEISVVVIYKEEPTTWPSAINR
jgi:hypothetical protein